MSCAGCSHSKLGEALKLVRRNGFAILRGSSPCKGCPEPAQGSQGVVFYTDRAHQELAEAYQRRTAVLRANAAGLEPKPVPQVSIYLNYTADGEADPVEAIRAACADVGLHAEWSGVAGDPVVVFL